MKRFLHILLLSAVVMLFNSCSVIEGIFKAGLWSGILIMVAIIALIIWIVAKILGGNKQ